MSTAKSCRAPRGARRGSISGRYIATPTVARHRLFVWCDVRICPDHQLIVIARDDDTTFRILHSRFHELWSLRLCTWLGKGNDPRYTPSTIFETFPFPAGLTPNAPTADYPGISFQIPMATGRPEIFNTDQGAQFTSDAFTSLLRAAEVRSAWTAAAGRSTTSSSNGSGGR